jgi:hypothetical protein
MKFCRKRTQNSLSGDAMEAQLMKDLIGTMHPYKDPLNIDKTKKYNYSIKSEQAQLETKQMEELRYQQLKPIEDFLTPGDVLSPRVTGYEPGHVRSLFKLDVYGPANSLLATEERVVTGVLPPPNVDRYSRLQTPSELRRSLSRSSRAMSPSSSRASTAHSAVSRSFDNYNSLNNTFRSRARATHQELLIEPSMRSLFHQSSADYLGQKNSLTLPSSLRKKTFTPGEVRITTADREQIDPFVRRKTWYQHHITSKKEQLGRKELGHKVQQYMKTSQQLAEIEKRRMREFEHHVALAKFQA